MSTSIARDQLSASSITGDEIKNRRDESLGTVHDLMIDCTEGRVAYVVMSSGGFLGMGNKLFAIPMTALKLDKENKCLRLDADKKTFENAQGFDKNNWPNMADQKWEDATHKSFGVRPYWHKL